MNDTTKGNDMTAPLCFIDTETDGVHPDRKVWEVAMIRRDESGETSTRFYVEIDLSTADPFGLKVGGFYDRHPLGRCISEGPMWGGVSSQYLQTDHLRVLDHADVALEVGRFTHGAHLVGAVPNFDADVLSRMMRDNGLTPSWHYHLIDVEAMAVGYLEAMRQNGLGENGVEGDPVRPPWRSDDLSLACGVQPPTKGARHTAMGDAEWAMHWYDAMTRATP